MIPRKKRNSSKVNLIISAVFHTVLIAAIFFLAAREGVLGKKLQKLTVTMEKVKKPEPPKQAEKPPEQKAEPKTIQTAKVAAPPPRAETTAAPPPAQTAPLAAPAAVNLSGMEFSDGAKEVNTISDPNGIYKALVEHQLQSRWNRPTDMADDAFVAEVELTVDKRGKVEDYRWVSGSGDKRWDDSVKAVFSQVQTITRPPPKSFPSKFIVRFDVESQRTEPVQFSSVP